MSKRVSVYCSETATLNEDVFAKVCEEESIEHDRAVAMLPYGAANVIGSESRWYYFDRALASDSLFALDDSLRPVTEAGNPYSGLRRTRIFSFGSCNMACPYCKRDCQFVDAHGRPIVAVDVPISDLFLLAETAIERTEVVRFSGGDPVMYARQCLAIAKYLWHVHHTKVSVAHNGSAPSWIERMLPYLDSVAVDVKATPDKAGRIMGLSQRAGAHFIGRSIESIRTCCEHENDVLVDVRTPLFGDTTLEDLVWIGEQIFHTHSRKLFWTIRLYSPAPHCDFTQPNLKNAIEMIRSLSEIIPNAWIGVRGRWHNSPVLFIKNGRILNDDAQHLDDVPTSGNRL